MVPLYLLACDHRRSFEKLFGVTKPVTPEEVESLKDAKLLVWEGFRAALQEGTVAAGSAGILTDLEYGEHLARASRELGIPFALPIEQSGRTEFELDARLVAAVREYQPTYVKALVRYNAEGDREMNSRQRERLRHISEWLQSIPCDFMLELLVPPTAAQLETVGNDRGRYDIDVRPPLMLQAIMELQDDGVDPKLWKIEGLASADDCRSVASLTRRHGRRAGCLVLGRGASSENVERWLLTARDVSGYVGFAIGRSIFIEALRQFYAKNITREEATAEIASNFAHFVSIYSAPATEIRQEI